MQNHQHHTFNLLHKDAISEEPSHYDGKFQLNSNIKFY